METRKPYGLAELGKYHALAENRAKNIKYDQEFLAGLFEKANAYVVECSEEYAKSGRITMTIAGWQLALGVNTWAWKHMRDGDYDHRLYEFLADEGLPEDYADTVEKLVYEKDGREIPLITYSEFIEGVYLRYQELLEQACLNNKNPVGSIFLLKSVHKFNDQSGIQVTNQSVNFQLGTMKEIETARKLLG